MAREIIVRILGDASSFDKATKQATTSAGKFSNVLSGIGAGLGIGFTQMAGQAAGAVVDFATDSIEAASNLNETMTKSAVIFGEGSAAVEDWAKTAASSMGLSQRAALDAASGFAGLFKTVGIALDESTEMAQDITGLGSDLASFFNTDMATALAALKSGLSGESEPLRQFNVFLSETAVSAKLAAMGIKKTGGAFTESEKATARYALIMEQTGDAQGDFERTSDGLANSQRTLDAKMENLQARLGEGLLPVVVTLTGAAVELMDVLDGKALPQNFVPSTYQAKDGMQGFADAISNALDFLTPWDGYASAAADRMNELGPAASEAAKAWDTGSERIATALGTVAAASETTKDDVVKDNRKIILSYGEVADYLLGAYNDDFDRAMGIYEARKDLHNAETSADQAEAYARLAEYGDLSEADYENWLTALERLAKGTKGKVREAYLDAMGHIKALRAEGGKPITIAVNYRTTTSGTTSGTIGGKAGGGSASGLTLVGEEGAELVNLPNGSYVYTATESKKMLSVFARLKQMRRSPQPPPQPRPLADILAEREDPGAYIPPPGPAEPLPRITQMLRRSDWDKGQRARSYADILREREEGVYAPPEVLPGTPTPFGDTYGKTITINATVNVTGPTLDPYGDFATRLSAALIPGLKRELARQGITL